MTDEQGNIVEQHIADLTRKAQELIDRQMGKAPEEAGKGSK